MDLSQHILNNLEYINNEDLINKSGSNNNNINFSGINNNNNSNKNNIFYIKKN